MNHSVYEHQLPNGAKGLVVSVPGASVCNLLVYFNSGFMFGNHTKYELPHVMEHLMGSGNALYPTAVAFKTEVEKNGAYRNASTSSYLNGYVYECAAFERDRILELLAAQISSPLFPEASFATEVSNVREELSRNTTEYGRLAWNALAAKTFPLGVVELTTRIEQLDRLTREDVVAYWRQTHTASNMRFFFAGDFSDGGKAFVERFGELTGAMPRGKYRPFVKQPPVRLRRPVVAGHDIKQLYYVIEAMAEGGHDARLDVALSVARALLVQGYRSWVLGAARERGLAYAVGGTGGVMPSLTEWGFSGYVTPDHAADLFALMAEQTQRLRTGDIPDDELAATQALMIGSSTRNQQTAGDILGWYASNYVYDNRIYPLEQRYDDVRAVKAADIVAAFEHLAAANSHGTGFVGAITDEQADAYARILEPLWQ